MKFLFCLLACVVLLSGCAPTTVEKIAETEGATRMTPDKVLELVQGNTLNLKAFDEDAFLFFDRSGRLFGGDIYDNSDTGQWDISEEGELCIRMSSWWYGDLRCFQVMGSEKGFYLASSNGALLYRVGHLAGDAKHLYRSPKKGKRKSYLASVRRKEAGGSQSSPAESAPAEKKKTPAIIEETPPVDTRPEEDLKSTVKWMARNCPNCNLSESDLSGAELITADLRGANLRWANLRKANLRRANLEGANLSAANLSHANLPGANLRDADLSSASLIGANLIRADLTGANLDGADLTDALLEGVIGLKK